MSRHAIAAVFLCAALMAPCVTSAETALTAAGSTALLPLVKASAETYQNQHPDVKISVSGGGSRVGITQVAAKAVDLGMSDIVAKDQPELVDHRVAVVGFAVLTHPGVGVKNVTKRQLQDIFSGKIANWKELGGADQRITVINRPRSSGTRAVFTDTIMGSVPVNESGLTEDATGTVVTAVRTTPGAVSYAAFSGTKQFADGRYVTVDGISELSIDGIAPSEESVTSGKYPIWSYEHIYTNGQPTKDESRFLAYIETNRALLHQLGYILIADMKVRETDR